jgi:acyl carrier protein
MQARVKSNIREYIVATWLSGDERGLEDDTDLQQAGILDSFVLLDLTAFLGSSFGVQLDPSDINAETFTSIDTIAELVLRKLPTPSTNPSVR